LTENPISVAAAASKSSTHAKAACLGSSPDHTIAAASSNAWPDLTVSLRRYASAKPLSRSLGSTSVHNAAIYQFVVLAMIFASSGLTCLISTTIIRAQVFSAAEQLVLRPGADVQR